MTDSMKFGPEWLRNMSADTTCSSNTTSGQATNTTIAFVSGGGDESAVSNNISIQSNANSLQNNVSSANSGTSRNTFPEFRYGREEMLLLFDRNCTLPDILPSYKNLFVERAQFPLALVPSTDEEMMQASTQSTQRPGWLQRSPVGFNTATRGTGRVGCIERGRMRGKSVYHSGFQRPNAMFEEEQRSSVIKADRSWLERNGGVAGDPSVSAVSNIGVGGPAVDSWNGNTPISSPRREFSNHPRNMENWRRNRNEDVPGGDSSAAPTFSTDGGWRMNSSGFQNSHTRWGRSISWRDDDLLNSENSGVTSAGTPISGGGGAIMPRSNSTMSTTHGDRIVQSGISNKSTGVLRSLSIASSGSRNCVMGNIWPNNTSVGSISNMQSESNTNEELALPEWAMENPSDIGGTFDASGAFHGAIDNEENADSATKTLADNDALQQTPSDEILQTGIKVQEKLCKGSDDITTEPIKSQTKSSLKENDSYQDLVASSPTPPSTIMKIRESTELSDENDNAKNNNSTYSENVSQKQSEIHLDNEYTKESPTNSSTNVQNYQSRTGSIENNIPNSNIGDYAERMMKATDDMIEKLIMDDEDAKDDNVKSTMLPAGNKVNAHSMFMTMQQSQSSNHPSSVSPALDRAAVPTAPSNVDLYNIGDVMVDHSHNMASLHQLQQQQMAAVAIGLQTSSTPPHSMTSSVPTDLWLYRDPQTKVQGPFSALEMTEWYRAGYFNENLFVRRVCDVRFRPLGELIKICNGQMPFTHSQLIPIEMNPSALTPPLPHILPTQPSTADFLIKTLSDHQQHQQHEKLKGNVTAAADSLNNALKSLINSVDTSEVLNMHFQTLQNCFIHIQEIEVSNELSKNECFRHLSPAEQDSVLRQKLQTITLPEYLTNLTGLRNSLAALNPTAGTQLYDTIVECGKKEQLFINNQGQQQSHTPASQQQRTNIHALSSSTPYMTADDFIMKTKTTSSDMNSNDMLNDFNLRMFLNNVSDSGTGNSGVIITTNSHDNEFINDQQLFSTGANQTNASQSPMMQIWMNSLATNRTNSIPNQQHSLLNNIPQAAAVKNQWQNGPLVGINSISLSTEQQGSQKPTPASMWDVATLEQHVHVQQQQHHLQQMQPPPFEHQRTLKDVDKHLQDHNDQQQNVHKETNKQECRQEVEQHQQKLTQEVHKCQDVMPKVSSTNDNIYKQDQQSQAQSQQQQMGNEKSNSHVNNKRNSNNNNNLVPKPSVKGKIDNLLEQVPKKSEEERRRDQNEEKRRQKEERKRQQMEEEKRRLTEAEEERRRQIQEDEKRQQQIQAQRRKALMANTNSNPTNYNCNTNNISPNLLTTIGNEKSKEQQRVQSSVAPWSTQTMSNKSQGPGLAEIQKAERRERRADQQRQLEIQEKQLRALATAAEAQDTILKWNAAPLPVRNFAEIQAEEAKRLAHEQVELQRRKEQDAHNNFVGFNPTVNVVTGNLKNSSNVSNIWSGNKIWGTSCSTSGFWEDPLKLNSKSLSVSICHSNSLINNTTTATATTSNNNNTITAASIISQSSNLQQKIPTTNQQQIINIVQQPSNKNIKKSQCVAVMQNSLSSPVGSASTGQNNQKKLSNNNASNAKQTKLQKTDNMIIATGAGGSENKKTTNKSSNTANKSDDYETEFSNWCTKSLNNMNAKVDVPTFVSFLRDLESPYEVKDYIRMYLGENKEIIDFAKQFLERRSKYKNLQRAQNAHEDDLCKPAMAITPSANDNSENKGKQKKVKKNKMTKLDARILGFSVTAAEGRINVGDRDYVDAL